MNLGVIFLYLPPSLLLILVMIVASHKVMVINITVFFIGFLLYPCLEFMKKQKWARFVNSSEVPDLPIHRDLKSVGSEDANDAEVGLLSAEYT